MGLLNGAARSQTADENLSSGWCLFYVHVKDRVPFCTESFLQMVRIRAARFRTAASSRALSDPNQSLQPIRWPVRLQ
jgi:hypothetical protein